MTLAELKAARVKAIADAKAIQSAAKAAARDLTDAEHTALEGHLASAESLAGDIKAEEAAVAKRRESLAKLDALDAELGRSAGRKAPATASAEIVPATPKAQDDGRRGFRNEKDFLLSVMNHGIGKAHDNRLSVLATAGSDEQSTFSDHLGGFLVPPAFMSELLKIPAEGDPTAGLTTKVPMGAPQVRIPARTDKDHTTSVTGGVVWTRNAESGDFTASKMTMEQVTIQAHMLNGLSYSTNELLSDSPISIPALISANFTEELGSKLMGEKLRGTGVGQYLGVLNGPATVSIAKENSQAAATIVYNNIIKMRARCWGYGRAIWLANHDTFPQLAQLQLPVGVAGSAVWMPSIQMDRPDMLLGRPIYFTEQCETLGTVGDIVLCDWSQYLEGQLGGMDSAQSIHVRFVQNETAFRFTLRNDGQPWWRSAITPKKGANSLSHAVTLATRS